MELIQKYFTNLSQRQIEQLALLEAAYIEWNSKINVISRQDISNLYKNHVLHSLVIAKFINFKKGTKILDAGTGGGLPGVPLAILYPNCQFVLADSIGKKLKVIDSVCEQLDINNVTTLHARVEDINDNYDFVVSRAVTRLDQMWNWVSPKIKQDSFNGAKNGLIYLKGGDIELEKPHNTIVQKINLNELLNDAVYEDKSLVYITKM